VGKAICYLSEPCIVFGQPILAREGLGALRRRDRAPGLPESAQHEATAIDILQQLRDFIDALALAPGGERKVSVVVFA